MFFIFLKKNITSEKYFTSIYILLYVKNLFTSKASMMYFLLYQKYFFIESEVYHRYHCPHSIQKKTCSKDQSLTVMSHLKHKENEVMIILQLFIRRVR